MNAALPPLDSLGTLQLVLLWLAAQPMWMGALLVVGGGVLLGVLGNLLVSAANPVPGFADFNLVGGAKFGYLAEVFAALVAFVLIDAGIRYTQARSEIQSEAMSLRLFGDTVAEMGDPRGAEVRRAVRDYARGVVETEYRWMEVGREHDGTRQALQRVIKVFLSLDVQSEHQRLAQLQASRFLTRAMESRSARLNAVRPGLRTLIWSALIANALLAVGFNWFFGSPNLRAQLAMVALLSSSVFLVVYMALVLSHPFTGDLAIGTRPFLPLLADS